MRIRNAAAISFCTAAVLLVCACSSAHVSRAQLNTLRNLSSEYYLIAEEYVKLKKYDNAVVYYQKLLSDAEYEMQATYKLARTYALASKWAESETLYQKLVDREPENTLLKTSLAYVLVKQGETETACALYEDIMNQHQFEPSAIKNAILAYAVAGNKSRVDELVLLFKEKFPLDDSVNDTEKKVADIFAKQEEAAAAVDAAGSAENDDTENPDGDQLKAAATQQMPVVAPESDAALPEDLL